jgi:hypothetical protein
LKPAADALLLDNSGQTIEESVDQVLGWWQGSAAVPGSAPEPEATPAGKACTRTALPLVAVSAPGVASVFNLQPADPVRKNRRLQS